MRNFQNRYIMRLLTPLLFTIASITLLISCNKQKETRNPPEIVRQDSDTVFNDIPGNQHLGKQAFNYDIVEELENVRKRHVFVNGLRKTGLLDTLKGKGPFTVFAPTDNAFPGYDENKPDDQQSINFSAKELKTYIVPGRIRKGDLAKGSITANNLNGQPLTLKFVNGKIIINDKIRVISEDINTKNGVIHEVDQLIGSSK